MPQLIIRILIATFGVELVILSRYNYPIYTPNVPAVIALNHPQPLLKWFIILIMMYSLELEELFHPIYQLFCWAISVGVGKERRCLLATRRLVVAAPFAWKISLKAMRLSACRAATFFTTHASRSGFCEVETWHGHGGLGKLLVFLDGIQ